MIHVLSDITAYEKLQTKNVSSSRVLRPMHNSTYLGARNSPRLQTVARITESTCASTAWRGAQEMIFHANAYSIHHRWEEQVAFADDHEAPPIGVPETRLSDGDHVLRVVLGKPSICRQSQKQKLLCAGVAVLLVLQDGFAPLRKR